MTPRKSIAPDLKERLGFAGVSEKFHQIINIIEQVAPTDISVLIVGESGTGKEMVAKAIHMYSLRKDRQMVSVNCGAIPEGILESELFGHEKGSFTGATGQRKGYFEVADGSTIFLDEIGEMSLITQVKLLRVLEQKEFIRVGGTMSVKVDSRVIAATNKDLERAVEKREFRKDLYYRLKAVTIRIPPLRERREDIEYLVQLFLSQFAEKIGIASIDITPEAMNLLEEYDWPGNVRELRNLMESLAILNKGKTIDALDLPENIRKGTYSGSNYLPVPLHISPEQAEREVLYRTLLAMASEISEIKRILVDNVVRQPAKYNRYLPPGFNRPVPGSIEEAVTMEENSGEQLSLKDNEQDIIGRALMKHRGNRRRAAKELGISERTLYRKIKDLNI